MNLDFNLLFNVGSMLVAATGVIVGIGYHLKNVTRELREIKNELHGFGKIVNRHDTDIVNLKWFTGYLRGNGEPHGPRDPGA